MSLETTTIGELNSGAPLVGTDQFVIERVGGNNFKVTSDDIETFVGGFVSPLTTKGDIYGYDTADARIPVGTDDQVLTADSTEDLGVAWKDVSGGSVMLPSAQGAFYNNGDGESFVDILGDQFDTGSLQDEQKRYAPKDTVVSALTVFAIANDMDVPLDIFLQVNGVDSLLTVKIPALTAGIVNFESDIAVAQGDYISLRAEEDGVATIGEVEFNWSISFN